MLGDPGLGGNSQREYVGADQRPQRPGTPASRFGGATASAGLIVAAFIVAASSLWIWALVEGERQLGDLPFLVWGILVAALGGASGAVFVFGLATRATINLVQRVDWQPLDLRAGGAALVAAALVSGNLVIDWSTGTARGVALTVVAVIGGTPAVAAMLGIRAAVARSKSVPTEVARRLQAYLELRGLASQLLTALGSLVALTTFSLAASMTAYGAWQGVTTVQVILVFGAFGTTLVGLGYQVPRAALRREARLLLDELTPLRGPLASQLCDELDAREKVERSLGLHTGLLTELQTGIVILSPLLAAATALLLPGG